MRFGMKINILRVISGLRSSDFYKQRKPHENFELFFNVCSLAKREKYYLIFQRLRYVIFFSVFPYQRNTINNYQLHYGIKTDDPQVP